MARTRNTGIRTYRGAQLEHLSWPLGGVGAALLGLTGAGGIDRIAIRHRADHKGNSSCFAALSITGAGVPARVLEGPVPRYKSFTTGRGSGFTGSCGFGITGSAHHGLPRMREAEFTNDFPFAHVDLRQPDWPLTIRLTAWCPFVAGDADASGMPVAALEYRIRNTGSRRLRAMFSFHALRDLLRDRGADAAGERIRRTAHGFFFDYPEKEAKPWTAGGLSIELDGALGDCAWFRGGWHDGMSMMWNQVQDARAVERAPHVQPGEPGLGASLWLPLDLAPGAETTAIVRLAWHEPVSDQRHGVDPTPAGGALATYRPRHAALYASADAVAGDFRARYRTLRAGSLTLAETLADSDVPAELLEAATANLPILRSPTVLRQDDGRLWGWEGSGVDVGSCPGSCTHVWNYAQAVAHLFPELERGLRETEFGASQDANGHQNFRAALPIGPVDHSFHAAADGQLGGIVKAWREWQLSGDTAWLRRMWPRIRASITYCIGSWDPDRTGALVEPHHNTYDIEFWGSDGMCGSVYASALKAAAAMAAAVDEDAAPWRALLAKAVRHLERELYRRGRFVQQVQRSTPRTGDAAQQKAEWNVNYSPEAVALLDREGPKYQYGAGVLSDGVVGAWLAEVSGLGSPLDPAKVRSHLAQIHRHNLRRDLRDHVNPQRPGYAIGDEGGLLLCTWPDGGRPALPFVYSDEVWTGIEHQVASHCFIAGLVDEGMDIVRACRKRYDGLRRNPFDEYECGHWYARALASWALLDAYTGVRWSAVEKTLRIAPRSARRPFRAPFVCGSTLGTITLGRAQVSIVLQAGSLELERIVIDGRAHDWRIAIAPGTRATRAIAPNARPTAKKTSRKTRGKTSRTSRR